MMKDFEKAKKLGIKAYQKELDEKIGILNTLLKNYNNGRRKNFFCIAVNLLELKDIRSAMKQIEKEAKLKDLSIKEKSAIAVNIFETMAKEREIKIELTK